MNWRTSPNAGKRLDWALLLGDFATASWLWFSFWSFNGQSEPTGARVLGPAAAFSVLALLLGTHRPRRGARALVAAASAGLAAAVLTHGAAAIGWLHVSAREALWLGAALAVMAWILRSFYWRLGGSPAARAGEVARWTAVGLAGTLVMLPFYYAGSVGSGDAHWYVVMLSDFLAQLKAGAFPVWVGQSPFAFNGAVSPLRYAPGFQYYGGIVDLLSAQALQPVAVKNLCLALSAIGGAFSAYACLRPMVAGRHWIACLLAILWIAGPGVLAPVTSGDQYMTFIALPFVPLVLHGCWRVIVFDDGWGRLWISAGLAALWVCHPPIGLWMTLIAGTIYLSAMLVRRSWALELRRLALMGAVFLAMGSFPFVSLLNLDNQLRVPSVGGSAAFEVHRHFPGNFLPINPAGGGLLDYQIGYALLGTLALSLLLMAFSRPKAAWAFAAASVLIVPFTVPVPILTDALWVHLPNWFVTINNVWPMQRLFLIWSALAAFTGAIVLGSPRISGPPWRNALVVAGLAGSLIWSAGEARKLAGTARRTRSGPEQTRIMEGPNNTELGRYAYSSFETTPGYASHGYMDGWFENRLLDRVSREAFLTNADAAAPGDAQKARYSTLIGEGMLTAENITQSTSYFLRPNLTLDPGKRYALRLEFFDPETSGVLQLINDTMFREYLLPDSGVGIGRSGPPRAFGTTATSGKVVPLSVLGKEPVPVKVILITPRADHKDFTAGRFWLYTYERSRLPIAVESWIPYRVRFTAPRPAFLESPRMWLKDWRPTVNGKPVPAERSPEGLVMVPVGIGANVVTLEYIPPAVVRASFWVFLGSWLVAGAAALGWIFGLSPPSSAQGPDWLGPLWRHKAALLGATAAVAAALYWSGRGATSGEKTGAAGPIDGMSPPSSGKVATDGATTTPSSEFGPVHLIVTFPYNKSERHEPILTTGRTGAGDIIYVFYEDPTHIRVGFDHWGFGGKLSDPIAVDYAEPHEIWVLEGALFPDADGDARWGATKPATRGLLKSLVAVVVDGKTVISDTRATYPSRWDEVSVGKNRIGASTADPEFSGIVRYSERTGNFLPPGLDP